MLSESQPSLLVVDDDERNLYSLKKILGELDVTIHTVNSGEKALKAIVNQEFFLILMDVCMPGMDGFETVSLIRGNENHKNIPIIFITAHSEDKFIEATYKEGVVDIIFKPIVLTNPLICKVKVFLELYLNRKELERRGIELARNIVAQNKAQKALLVKEQEQCEILNSIVDAVITLDETGNITSFNKTAEKLFGYSIDEIIGQNFNQLMPASEASKYNTYLQHYMKIGDAQVIEAGLDIKGQHKSKKDFLMHLSIAELPVDETGKRRFIISCHDLTAIKQQEEQLRRSQKMDALGKLTGGIAHDYNNMLGVILGYSELLKSMLTDKPKLLDYLDHILHAGKRGAKLTKKLLSFSRQEAHEAGKVDINALLWEQQDMLQKTLTVRIKLLVELPDEVWPIWLDNNDLEDAVLNMSINAMHAMSDKESGAKLTIRTCNQSFNELDAQMIGLKAGDYVQLSLTDTGIGMDDATKEKIFDPFFSTKGEQGTGLGLSQVFGFVKRAGGSIKVNSEPGHGSEFVLYFPRYFDDDIKNITEISKGDIELTGNEKLLIVDDEAALRNWASELLSQKGYQIFCAENGKQALKILEHEDIDLMLSDVIMPEMNGSLLAAIVREKYPAIKIQMVSGFTDEGYMNMMDESFSKNLLFKPYNSQVLLKNIRDLLDE